MWLRLQTQELIFDNKSHSQVIAYFATEDAQGAIETLATTLQEQIEAKLRGRLQRALQKGGAESNEHSKLGAILDVLSARGGPHTLLHHMQRKHLKGLLAHMGHDAFGMSSVRRPFCKHGLAR